MTKTRILTILLAIFMLAPLSHAEPRMRERCDRQQFFSEFDTKGAIVVADEREGHTRWRDFDSLLATSICASSQPQRHAAIRSLGPHFISI